MLEIPPIQPIKVGPLPLVQFTIEWVGPRSVLASEASELLNQEWYQGLGMPYLWCMSPSDASWQRMQILNSGSYDSIAASWDIVGDRGHLQSSAAMHLLKVAESFGSRIERRPIPLPTPPEIDTIQATLIDIQASFDIGVTVFVLPTDRPFLEQDIWTIAKNMGLFLSGYGQFEWKSANHPSPLFALSPAGEFETFTLAQVHAQSTHPSLQLGFSLPRCPDPLTALEGMLLTANTLAKSLGGIVTDEDGRRIQPSQQSLMKHQIQQALQSLSALSLRPGSAELLRLFPLEQTS